MHIGYHNGMKHVANIEKIIKVKSHANFVRQFTQNRSRHFQLCIISTNALKLKFGFLPEGDQNGNFGVLVPFV